MAGGGGTTSSTTTQKADPWVGLQPALSGLYNNANQAYGTGDLAPNINTGNYTPMNSYQWDAVGQLISGNQYTNNALTNTQQLANGNFANNVGGQTLASLAQGTDAGSQTLLGITNGQNVGAATLAALANGSGVGAGQAAATQLFNAQANPITKQFQTATLPGLLSAYSAAGRYGSGSNDTAINAASDSLSQNLGNLAQSTIANNYFNERDNQMAAAGTLASVQGQAAQALSGSRLNASNQLSNLQGSAISALDQMGWNRAQQALQGGTLAQQDQQNWDNSIIAQNNYNVSKPMLSLQTLSQLLQGGLTLNGQTTSQSGNGGVSGASKALGGAASGALAGSAFGPWGTAIGAGAGLLMGSLS